MIDRSTREPPSRVTLRVSPNAVLELIDSGDFLAGVMRVGVATAVRDSSARQRYEGAAMCALWGFAKGGCETSQG